MRFYKLIFATLLLGTLLVASVIYARSTVVTSLLNNYLAQHDSAITCIDFSVDAKFDLVISHLCIDSPYADVELKNIVIVWRFDLNNIQKDSLVEAISSVKIDLATIQDKGKFKIPEGQSQKPMALAAIPEKIRQNIVELSELSPSIAVDLKHFIYHPPNKGRDKQEQSYTGEISANSQRVYLSLNTLDSNNVITIELLTPLEELTADITVDLLQFKQLLIRNQRVFPSDIERELARLAKEDWEIKGSFNSQLSWHKQKLQVVSNLTDFSLKGSDSLSDLGIADINTSLAWQLTLVDEQVELAFESGSKVLMTLDQVSLNKFLLANGIDKPQIEVLEKNPLNLLALAPLGTVAVDFANQNIQSDGVAITSNNLGEPLKVTVSDIVANFKKDIAFSVNIQQASLSSSGLISVPQLQPFSNQAIKFNIFAEGKQLKNTWRVKVNPNSSVQLSNFAFNSVQGVNNSEHSKQNNLAKFKRLKTNVQGEVFFAKQLANVEQTQPDEISVNLLTQTQLDKLEIPQVIKFDSVELNTELKGNFSNISLTTEVIAENLPIAHAKITGNPINPSINISAKDLLLTDLLALKIKPPVELSLIDGRFNYQLSGEVKNNNDFLDNPMQLTVSVQDVTGEVDGTWIQGLNWQQDFLAQNGKLTSVADTSEQLDNLSIEKIEIATPITDFKTSTFINLVNNEVQLKLGKTRGGFLGGEFAIDNAEWPFNKDQAVTVSLVEIDLEKLLELDQKQGIVITGRVSGELPIFYDGEHFLIEDGNLFNVGNGLIQVFNNPAVEELKITNTQLKLAFDALENLHYHQLKSEVSMANDGYMLLVTAIKGKNPDLDNEVNLNLNLSYDLLGLLESLNITEHFEEKFIKGLQPN